jgi:hypothetical protein
MKGSTGQQGEPRLGHGQWHPKSRSVGTYDNFYKKSAHHPFVIILKFVKSCLLFKKSQIIR